MLRNLYSLVAETLGGGSVTALHTDGFDVEQIWGQLLVQDDAAATVMKRERRKAEKWDAEAEAVEPSLAAAAAASWD